MMKHVLMAALLGALQMYAGKPTSYVDRRLPEIPKKSAKSGPLPILPKIPKFSAQQMVEAIEVEEPNDHDLEIVRRQLETYPELIDVVADDNNNILMLALENDIDDVDFILELLDKTKNLEHRNKYGETVIFKAARYPHLEILEKLLKRGARVDVADQKGKTPLMAAVSALNTGAINLLLKAGAPMDLKTVLRMSPDVYAPDVMSGIVQKVMLDLVANKLSLDDINPQWRGVLGKLNATLQQLFSVAEQLAKGVSAVDRVADQVVFIYVDHTEKRGGVVSNEFTRALSDGGMVIIATTHVVLNAIQRFPDYSLIPKMWDTRLADESNQIVVFFPQGVAPDGIRRDGMKRVSIDELKEIGKKQDTGKHPDQYLIPALPKIFVTKKEYAQQRQIDRMPRLAFYIDGHGELASSLSGLSIDSFQSLLNFFDTQIRTVFFAYTSCFALGTNTQTAFQDVRAVLTGKTYSFPIATNGKIDDLTYSGLHNLNYRAVVSLLTQADTLDLAKILPVLFGDITATQPAFVRFPGTAWFVPFDAVTKSISIGFPLIAGRTQPLRVQDQLILLYEDAIPFELKVTSADHYPHFLSMVPGTAVHYFSSIDIGPNDFTKFIQHMIKELPQRRLIFWIKRLSSTKQQAGIFQGAQVLEDVIIEFSPDADGKPFAFYVHLMKNNAPYRLEGDRLLPRTDYRPAFEKFFLDTMGESLSDRLANVAAIQKRGQDLGRLLQQRKDKAAREAAPQQTGAVKSKVPALPPKPAELRSKAQ